MSRVRVYNFETPRAEALVDAVLDAIRNGIDTADGISEATGMPKGTYGRYIAYLKKQGLIHVSSFQQKAGHIGRGSFFAKYALGRAQSDDAVPFGIHEYDEEIHLTVTDWPDGMAKRDPFDVLLFGEPKQNTNNSKA